MLNPIICPRCFQPNEPARKLCWKCIRGLALPATREEYEKIFDLKADWTVDELRLAFRRLAKKYHPDANPGDREADAHFKFVNLAYEALSRVARRKSEPRLEEKPPAAESTPEKKTARAMKDLLSGELQERLDDLIRWRDSQPAGPVKKKSWLRRLWTIIHGS